MKKKEENLHAPNSIRTFTGQYFSYVEMNPDTIKIEDIAHALSNIPRWMGHTNVFYSVAQHCCWCHDALIEPDEAFERLMHDATEAYLGDCPSPLKSLLPSYKEIEHQLSIVIAKKFGYNYPYSVQTKLTDKAALEFEWENIRMKDQIEYWSPDRAKQEFLDRFYKYVAIPVTQNK